MYSDLRRLSNLLWFIGAIFTVFAFRILIHFHDDFVFHTMRNQPFLIVSICCYVVAIPVISFVTAFYVRRHHNELVAVDLCSSERNKSNHDQFNQEIQKMSDQLDKLKEQLNKDN